MKNSFALLLFFAGAAHAATRPQYGGTLRLEMAHLVTSLDPRQWPADGVSAASAEKLASLIFERLVTIDDFGRPQPLLAIAWHHDADYKRWQFTLRAGVEFHDGTRLSAAAVAAALQPLLGKERQITASSEAVVIQSAAAMPELLEELGSGRYFIFRVQPGGSLSGTGPFRMSDWPRLSASQSTRSSPASSPAEGRVARAVFAANQNFWNGRPFVDSVEATMGISAQRQFQDLQLGKVDLVELTPDQIRRATQAGFRTWSSVPVELFALVFGQETPWDPRIRQALSLSIDRAAITNVLLQRLGEPAGGLLPQWLSGYAFLFSTAADTEHARQLRVTTRAAGMSASKPLHLSVENDDDTARLIAERIALNARPTGIAIQIARSNPDVRLVRWRVGSVAAHSVLQHLVRSLDPSDESAAALKKISSNDPEQTYAAERTVIEGYRVIPLVYLPETIAMGPAVRDWMPARWAAWRLEDVWLDRTLPALNQPGVGPSGAKP